MVKSGEDAGEKRRRILKGALVLLNDLPTGGFPLLNSRSRLSQERPAGNGNVLGVMLEWPGLGSFYEFGAPQHDERLQNGTT